MFGNTSLTRLGIKAQANYKTMPEGEYAPMTLLSWSVDTDTKRAEPKEADGRGEKKNSRVIFAAATGKCSFLLRAQGNENLLSASLGGAWASQVSVVGSSNISVDPEGTHADGSTGPQFIAPAGTFNPFKTYGGAAANGAEALIALVTGSSEADNNGRRRIKHVHADGTKLDIFPQYSAGAEGLHGSEMVETEDESITISVGTAVRNRIPAAGSEPTAYAVIGQLSNGLWSWVRGVVFGDPSLKFTGQGEVVIDCNWMAAEKRENEAAAPVGDFSFGTPATESTFLTAAADLALFAVVPAAVDAPPLRLSGLCMTGFSFTSKSGLMGIDNISGTTARQGVVPGMFDGTAELSYSVTTDDADTVTTLTALGQPGTEQPAWVEGVWVDPQGKQVAMSCYADWDQPNQSNLDASDKPVEGTMKSVLLPNSATSRTVIFQRWV